MNPFSIAFNPSDCDSKSIRFASVAEFTYLTATGQTLSDTRPRFYQRNNLDILGPKSQLVVHPPGLVEKFSQTREWDLVVLLDKRLLFVKSAVGRPSFPKKETLKHGFPVSIHLVAIKISIFRIELWGLFLLK